MQSVSCFRPRVIPRSRKNPQTQQGYVHSLGHGIGLNIHERPWSGISSDEKDCLVPGAVFTVEPGLYYPDKGMGVRLENSLWVRPDGKYGSIGRLSDGFGPASKRWINRSRISMDKVMKNAKNLS